MQHQVKHDRKYQQFSIELEDDEAELAYALPEPGVISFTHTFVPESARGNGLADKLIKTGFDYAEKNNLKIIAGCDVVKAYLKRHPEFKRLLK